jgi:hypothetical protein
MIMGKTALLSNFGVIVKLQSSRIFIRSGSDSTLALNFNKIPGFVKPSMTVLLKIKRSPLQVLYWSRRYFLGEGR